VNLDRYRGHGKDEKRKLCKGRCRVGPESLESAGPSETGSEQKNRDRVW
jgi:hypothetical protein